MNRQREIVIELDDLNNVRLRRRFTLRKGKVIHFTVQLEVLKTSWKVVIRYDNAHGFVHLDRIKLNGQQRKERLELTEADALTYAINDLKAHWQAYVARFLRGDWP